MKDAFWNCSAPLAQLIAYGSVLSFLTFNSIPNRADAVAQTRTIAEAPEGANRPCEHVCVIP